MGYRYSRGEVVPRNEAQAVALYARAASLGNHVALYNLGSFYQSGRGGLMRDDKTAAEYYEQSIVMGSYIDNPLLDLGDMLEKGQGVDQDLNRARALYAKAARIKNCYI